MASFQPVFNLESDKIQPSYQSLTNLCCFGICNLSLYYNCCLQNNKNRYTCSTILKKIE